jgi:hypothetical protein
MLAFRFLHFISLAPQTLIPEAMLVEASSGAVSSAPWLLLSSTPLSNTLVTEQQNSGQAD